MPICLICDTDFAARSWDYPGHDCDCGGNYSRKALRDSDPDGSPLATRQQWWADFKAEQSALDLDLDAELADAGA